MLHVAEASSQLWQSSVITELDPSMAAWGEQLHRLSPRRFNCHVTWWYLPAYIPLIQHCIKWTGCKQWTDTATSKNSLESLCTMNRWKIKEKTNLYKKDSHENRLVLINVTLDPFFYSVIILMAQLSHLVYSFNVVIMSTFQSCFFFIFNNMNFVVTLCE